MQSATVDDNRAVIVVMVEVVVVVEPVVIATVADDDGFGRGDGGESYAREPGKSDGGENLFHVGESPSPSAGGAVVASAAPSAYWPPTFMMKPSPSS